MTDNLIIKDGNGTITSLKTSEQSGTHTPHQISKNLITKFREAFEDFDPVNTWSQTLASGDVIAIDGNTVASSYLVISKDPLSTGVSSIETITSFEMPYDMSVGLSLSQRTTGQEFSVEVVSTDSPMTAPVDIAISSIQQATTTLTVTTATAHNLKPGMRIGIRDVIQNSALNYPALVVATTPSETQFTATAGPAGTITSLTVGPYTSGYVFQRSALGYATDGTSLIFENGTATQGSIYVRSQSGDVLPSGTLTGNHVLTVGTTATVQAVNAALAYSFQPTTEYRLSAFVDGLQWSDCAVDSVAGLTHRLRRSQVVPDHNKRYKLRFRATNNASLSRPVAQIISAIKSGTTTATVTTDVPHGLTTGDVVVCYGARDYTNFANLSAATAVASVVNSTTFTVVWGSAVTATSYGGYVAKVNGGNLMSSLGAVTQAVQSASRTSNIVALVGNTTWTGSSIGDYINLIGCRNIVDGSTLGIDGVYRVRDMQASTIYLEPVGSTPTGANILSTNCGGGLIKRTDLRISFARILDFERQRVEFTPRASTDLTSSLPVVVANNPGVSLLASTVLAADVGIQFVAGRGSGITVYRLLTAAATTNATSIKATPGKLAKITAFNAATSLRYLKLYNKASAPTVGTDTPIATLAMPPSAMFEFNLADIGLIFTAGIAYAITTGSADADTTAVTAGDIVGLNIFYA